MAIPMKRALPMAAHLSEEGAKERLTFSMVERSKEEKQWGMRRMKLVLWQSELAFRIFPVL